MTVTLVMSAEHGRLYLPWEFAARVSGLPVNDAKSWLMALVRCVANRVFVYTFAWLLPLGVWRLSHFPRAWRVAAASGVAAALAMGAYDNAAGNTVRAFFNIAGPMLSVSAAVLLSEIFRATERHHA
jgi:hypothetical protein